MQESGAKRPAKLLQRASIEENDRADTLSDACQEGEADGDVPAHLSKMTKSAEAPEATQEAPLVIKLSLSLSLSPSGSLAFLSFLERAQLVPEKLRVDSGRYHEM